MAKLTKIDLFDYINNLKSDFEDVFNIDELSTHSREGIHEMLELGEYAFEDYEDQWDYDNLVEDIKESCKAEYNYDGEINYVTWSSKSGTSVFVDAFEYDGCTSGEELADNVGYDHESFEIGYSDIEDYTYSELIALRNDLVSTLSDAQTAREAYDKQIDGLKKIIGSVAYGERSGCFSNGEVIFTPTEAYEGATADFTPYYNPNEECA